MMTRDDQSSWAFDLFDCEPRLRLYRFEYLFTTKYCDRYTVKIVLLLNIHRLRNIRDVAFGTLCFSSAPSSPY